MMFSFTRPFTPALSSFGRAVAALAFAAAVLLHPSSSSATYKTVQITKVKVYADGSAMMILSGSGVPSTCQGGAGHVFVGPLPWQAAPAAMLAVALRAAETGRSVVVDVEYSGSYCISKMIQEPS